MDTHNQRIMVVDDDPNIAQLIRLYLESEGYHVEHYMDRFMYCII